MTAAEAREYIGGKVFYRNDRLMINGVYTLSGLIIRRSDAGTMYAQAELSKDNAVLITSPSELQPIWKGRENEKTVTVPQLHQTAL